MSNKSITQVLGDGLAYQVSGRGRLCCEEAALTANEVERLTRERDEARGSRDYWIDLYGELRDELQAKLDAAEVELKAIVADRDARAEQAANRPTLDRDTVYQTVIRETHGKLPTVRMDNDLTDAIMALVPAEGWPEWMGPKVDPGDFEMRRTEKGRVVGEDGQIFAFEGVTAERIRDQVHSAVEYAAQLKAAERFIEAEQAKANTSGDSPDEDQRVEDVARKLAETMNPASDWPDDWAWEEVEAIRHAARAGWTPPDNPV